MLYRISLIVVLSLIACTAASAAEHPFEGQYLLVGSQAQLLNPGVLHVQIFYNPTCSNCHLFHKYSHGAFEQFAGRVEFSWVPYVHGSEGLEAIRLVLVAAQHGKEQEALERLFKARFVSQVDIDDREILNLIAEQCGLQQQYASQRNAPYVEQRLEEAKDLSEKLLVERTPSIWVEQVLQINSGTCKCQGDELPAVVVQTLNNLIAYRQQKGIDK
ncbi:MAG: DsbA family protein [Candidatus Alcyoniella australis]|nr:DsbA family protein [Candidatus Alcyoniella australis]